MRVLRTFIVSTLFLGCVALAPAIRADHWRFHDGHWSHWYDADKSWYYTDGKHWYYEQKGKWHPYHFDRKFGGNFKRGTYKYVKKVKVAPTHRVYVERR